MMKIDKSSDCDECYRVAPTVRLGGNTPSGATRVCMDCLQQALKLIEPLHDDDVIVCPDCDGARYLRVFSEEQREYPCNSCMATGQMTRKEARELRLVPSVIED